jgi:hypothetical protein
MSERLTPPRIRAMIARLDHLRKHASVFKHLTGLVVEVFDELAAQVVPAIEAAHKKKLERPGRQRAIGGATTSISRPPIRYS